MSLLHRDLPQPPPCPPLSLPKEFPAPTTRRYAKILTVKRIVNIIEQSMLFPPGVGGHVGGCGGARGPPVHVIIPLVDVDDSGVRDVLGADQRILRQLVDWANSPNRRAGRGGPPTSPDSPLENAPWP